MSQRKVTVTFSEAQARALNVVLAFAEGEPPSDRGIVNAAEQRAVRNARVMLRSAMEGSKVALIEPEPTKGPALAYGGPSVHADIANFDLQLWWRKPLDPENAVEVRIPIEEIPRFLSQVTNQAMNCMESAVQSIGYGDCEACRNIRLVDVELSGGRKTNTECPTCRANGGPRITTTSVLRGAPTVGPKVKPEVADWVL